ncbi:MAG TPA: hypothetical protein VI524_00540, partial [Anaerolineales bacterium]|nr:hypothetical protein [Anaerolineales bacterium]
VRKVQRTGGRAVGVAAGVTVKHHPRILHEPPANGGQVFEYSCPFVDGVPALRSALPTAGTLSRRA